MAIASAIVGGLIAGAGAVGSAVIGSKAAGKASQASQASADAAVAAQERARASNQANLSPFLNNGTLAGNQINALLGLGGSTTPGTPGQVDWGAYVNGNEDALANWNAINGNSSGARFGGDINAFGQFHYQDDGSRRDLSRFTSGGTPASTVSSQQAAQGAFENFRNSTGYDFRLNQGLNAVNSGYAGAGTLKSGAAMKGISDYGQGMATQEFGNYMNALQGQQGVGLQAGSSIAGVSQNAANSMGQIYQQNGANQANASLLKAQNTGQAINSLATLGAGMFGQSGGGSGFNANALNAGTAAYSPTINSPFVGQTSDWRTW